MPPKRRANQSILDQKAGRHWGPPTWNLDRKRAGRVDNGVQRPARYPTSRVAMEEIIKHRRDGGYLIPKASFYPLCQEIVRDLELLQRLRWQSSAVECLQVEAEKFLVMTMTGRLNSYPNNYLVY